MDIKVSKNSMVPIYYQIQDQIREKIENEELIPGTKLPSERELSSELDVNRATVRKAMRGLITEGLCTKKVGKGIYIDDEKITMNLHNTSGTTSFINKLGLKIETNLISKKIIDIDKKINTILDNEDNKLLYIKRVRYINDEPLMLEKNYLPLKRFEGIENKDFNQSLYKILEDKFNVHPNFARATLNVKTAKDEESQLLNLQLNSALIEKEVTVFDQNRLPIEYNKTYYRSDKFSFTINSKYCDE